MKNRLLSDTGKGLSNGVYMALAMLGLPLMYLQGQTLDTLRHLNVQPLGEYSAIWGYAAPDGREYAVLGVNGASSPFHAGGTSIIDITNPAAAQQVAFVTGPTSIWREMKTYKHYAYVVSEGGGGVQIINLSQLPDTAWLVKSFTYTSAGKNINRTHSISIHDGFMYLNGCANWSPGGTLIFDLRNDPENPQFVGQYQPAYLHDTYVLRDTIYGSAINGQGLYIADARNKASISTIGLISYTSSGTHNAWVTKDRQYVITTDEIGGTPKTLKFWNISNLPTIPSSPTSTYTATPGQIEHNVTVRGDYAYVAWYSAGVRVVNVSNPASPTSAGGYDTSPFTTGMEGAWGVYPYFPSGKIIASDIQNGLWVFSFSDLAARVPVNLIQPAHLDTVFQSSPKIFRWSKAASLSKDPHRYGLTISGPGVDTVFNVGDSLFTLSVYAGFQSGQIYQWYVHTLDEFNVTANPDTFSFVFHVPPPAIPSLASPLDGALNQASVLGLAWNASPGATLYRVQLSTDSIFASLLLDDSTITGTSHVIGPLAFETCHFWRVAARNGSGQSAFTAEWDFTTTISPPLTPVLTLPEDSSVDIPLDVLLVWSPSNEAASYHLQVGSDSLFTALVVDDSSGSDTTRNVIDLNNLTTYYWRVRAKNQGGYSPFSEPFRFTTIIAVPSTPVLVQPGNGAGNQQTSLDLIWRQSLFASAYHLQWSRDSLFSTAVVNDSSLADTVRHIDSLEVGTTYYWHVRGENSSGISAWSETRTFVTTLQVTGQYPVSGGWNLVAVPLSVVDPRATVLYPEAVSGAFAFSPMTGYVGGDTLSNGKGYWLKFAADHQTSITGDIRLIDTIAVGQGWNLVGGLSEPVSVSSIGQIPSGIVTSVFFGYNNNVYASVDSLHPSVGYWVKASQSGYLIMQVPPATLGKGSLKSKNGSKDVPLKKSR